AASAAGRSTPEARQRRSGRLPLAPCRQRRTGAPAHAFRDWHLSVGDGGARADGPAGELVHRVAAGAPGGTPSPIKPPGEARMPLADVRPDHRGRIKLPAIDAHGAAETTADIEGGFDDRIARETRGDRLEIRNLAGQAAAGHSVSSSSGKRASPYMG